MSKEQGKILIKELKITNFRCFEEERTIEFEDDLTTFIGANGAGKSTVFKALLKLLSNNPRDRVFEKSDFIEDKAIIINILIELQNMDRNDEIIYSHGDHEYINVEVIASLHKAQGKFSHDTSFAFSYFGNHEKTEQIYVTKDGKKLISKEILTPQEQKDWQNQDMEGINLRDVVTVYYIPSHRDSNYEIQSLEGVLKNEIIELLGDNTESKDEKVRDGILGIFKCLDVSISSISSVQEMKILLDEYWKKIFPESEVSFSIYSEDLRVMLKYMDWLFDGLRINQLSDGQKSIAYILTIMALIKLRADGGNVGRILIVEEPETYLSPQIVGRLIAYIKEFSNEHNLQIWLTTHSTVAMKRLDPYSIRFFKKNQSIKKLKKEYKRDDYKYIKNAVRKNPELYFADLVVLVEGDSEEDILPVILEKCKFDVDPDLHGISITPLGGRFVTHMWRLMEELDIKYITLLDLDLGKNKGGIERIKEVKKEMKNYERYNGFSLPEHTTNVITLANAFEEYGVYFSLPLDFDFMMLDAYEDEYKRISEGSPALTPVAAMDKILTKKSESGNAYDHKEHLFNWYNYLFLGESGKPTRHKLTLKAIMENQDWDEKLPEPILKLIKEIKKKLVHK